MYITHNWEGGYAADPPTRLFSRKGNPPPVFFKLQETPLSFSYLAYILHFDKVGVFSVYVGSSIGNRGIVGAENGAVLIIGEGGMRVTPPPLSL
jgi:hypothetical protein